MEQHKSQSTSMRVAVVSASPTQREHLKQLIESCGPQVTGVSGFRDYPSVTSVVASDVLLIDLNQADDDSLDSIESMVEQSSVPILFNESTTVPMAPGPYRDDWVDNLVGKLYGLAFNKSFPLSAGLLERPHYAQSTHHTFLKVLIVSHSKTRRRVLQTILDTNGIHESANFDFESVIIDNTLRSYDVLLLDEHNVGPGEQEIFNTLCSQTDVPIHLCNSSKIPTETQDQSNWGDELTGNLVNLAKSRPSEASAIHIPELEQIAKLLHAPENTATHYSDTNWGDRLANKLAEVRSSIQRNAFRPARRSRPATVDIQSQAEQIVVAPLVVVEQPTNTPSVDARYKAAPKVLKTPKPAVATTTKINAPAKAGQFTTRQTLRNDELRKNLRYLPPNTAAQVNKNAAPVKATRSAAPAAAPTQISAHAKNIVQGDFSAPAKNTATTPTKTVAKTTAVAAPLREMIDANNLNQLNLGSTSVGNNNDKKLMDQQQHETEIARFFNFDAELEAFAQNAHVQPKVAVNKNRVSPPIMDNTMPINPFGKQKILTRLFTGLRKKLLPKLFH